MGYAAMRRTNASPAIDVASDFGGQSAALCNQEQRVPIGILVLSNVEGVHALGVLAVRIVEVRANPVPELIAFGCRDVARAVRAVNVNDAHLRRSGETLEPLGRLTPRTPVAPVAPIRVGPAPIAIEERLGTLLVADFGARFFGRHHVSMQDVREL